MVRLEELAENSMKKKTNLDEESSRKKNCFNKRIDYISRWIAVLLSHGFVFEGEVFGQLFQLFSLLGYCFNLITDRDSFLINGLVNFPKKNFYEVVTELQNNLAIYVIQLNSGESTKEQIKVSIRSLDAFYRANLISNQMKPCEFVNETVSDELSMQFIAHQYYLRNKKVNNPRFEMDFIFLDYPWIFSTAAKVDVIQYESQLIQGDVAAGNMFTGGPSQGGIMGLMNNVYLNVKIRRDHILEDSLQQVASQGSNLKKPLKVKFIGEAGEDAGGVRKEYFVLLMEELFKPDYAMFELKQDRLFWFNKLSCENDLSFELTGNLLGLAIYNSVLLDVRFPLVVYKKLVDEVPVLEDLKEIEPELFTTLRNIQEMSSEFESLNLTFQISYDSFGEERFYNLLEDGSEVPLTLENKDLFITLYLDWFMNISIENQFRRFYDGFYKVMSKQSVKVRRL